MEESYTKLAETETPNIRGSSVTSYGLQPVTYLKELIDGAKNQMMIAPWVREIILPKGTHQISIPKRKQYKGYHGETWNTAGSDTGGTGAGTGPYANTIADISWDTVDNYDSVTATPIPVILGKTLRKFDLDTNVINYLEEVKVDLMYDMADRIETKLAQELGDATNSTSTAAGAQTLFGGDTTGSDSLSTGDTLTTDMIVKATRKLGDLQFGYRASGAYGAETLVAISSYRKNPWQNTPDDPYVMWIGPAQEEALRKDSQFVNAAEFGRDVIIREGREAPGFFAKYIGVYIVTSNHMERTASGSTAPDGRTAAVNCTQCILAKPKKAIAAVYGKKPELTVWEYHERDEKRLKVVMYYTSVVLHSDAIIKILVSDA
ncbi:hypothetical protein DRN69_08365 [Candidatus Pacearchaeota archaeon]|nr:MAG: hypothetical protein DRN69_08365 [Candidatus Pacearchaeota archaeon]